MIYYRKMPEKFCHTQQRIFALELLEEALRREYGIFPLPEIARSEKGKPYFAGNTEICFNYSHSKRGAACVLSSDEVGIDLEEIRPFREIVARRFCHEKEWEWLMAQRDKSSGWIRIWTMKEAYLKYRGTGLRDGLDALDFSRYLESDQMKLSGRGLPLVKQPAVVQEDREWNISSICMENSWLSVCQKCFCCMNDVLVI